MKPVIKWAGGKGFLVDTVKDMQPKGYKRYYEPFAGGAAVLLGLQPTAATLNDINPELTNVYIQIKSNPAAVIEELTELDNRHQTAANPRDFYYAVRTRFNLCMGTNTPAQAARFIYLNKHCFNGLYRVNSSGDFNVPFNGRVSGNSFTAVLCVQNLDNFKKEVIYDILSNIHYFYILASNNANSLTTEVVCKMAGSYYEKEKSYAQSNSTSVSTSYKEKQILRPEDLNQLGDDAVLLITNYGYVRTNKNGSAYYKVEPFKSQYEKIVAVNRNAMLNV